jgi:hypothetical protein
MDAVVQAATLAGATNAQRGNTATTPSPSREAITALEEET